MEYKLFEQLEDKHIYKYNKPHLYRELKLEDIKIGSTFEENSTDYDKWKEIRIETEDDVEEWRSYFLCDGVPNEFRIKV